MQSQKLYNIESSPLFGLCNKRRLCDLLHTDIKSIKFLVTGENYWISEKINSAGNKKRTIYAPKPTIKAILKRLHKLLSRIRVPDYLFSGKKGVCYVDNATEHTSSRFVTTIDISDFYNKCSKKFVFKAFRYTFNMSEDVAWLITDLVTYDNFIPTGSPTSQLVAFWAYKGAFDRIHIISKNHNSLFTLFVDDMAFSSDKKISWKLELQAKKELEYVGHSFNPRKVKRYGKYDYKIITGCVITPTNKLKVKNKQRKCILDSWNVLHSTGNKDLKSVKSLLGKIQSTRQIEDNLFPEKYAYLTHLTSQQKEY